MMSSFGTHLLISTNRIHFLIRLNIRGVRDVHCVSKYGQGNNQNMNNKDISFARNLVKGKIDLLKHPQIPAATQAEFLKILNDFEG